MKATISTQGDMSVGIWPEQFKVDMEDCLNNDDVDREEVRKILSDCFASLVGEPVTCYFDGEFEPEPEPDHDYPIVDFSEPMLSLKMQLRIAEEAALLKDYSLALEALHCARGHMVQYSIALDQLCKKEKKNGR